MQQSGITLVTALKISGASIRNTSLFDAVGKAAKLVETSGIPLSVALSRTGHFPKMMLRLVDVGVSSGQICAVLDKIAFQYEKEVDTSLKRIAVLIEPIMIILVGLLAGTVVISIFLPMFNLIDVL